MGLRVMPSLPELTAQQQDEIRQACGFACVRCGVTIYRYLRLPEGHGVTLLCPTCHGLVEEGRLTPMQVQGFHANPVVRQRHFARDRLPFSPDLPSLIMGGSQLLRDTPIPLTLEGEPILIFAPPRRSNGATRISVRMGGADGEPVQVLFTVIRPARSGEFHDPDRHLEMMRWIARLGRDQDFRRFALQARTRTQLVDLLKEMAHI